MTNARRLILLGGVILFAAGMIGLFVPVTISGGIGCGNAVHSDLSAAREQDNRNVGNSPVVQQIPIANQLAPKASSSRPATRLWVTGACGRFRWPWSAWPALAGPLRSVGTNPPRASEPSARRWPRRTRVQQHSRPGRASSTTWESSGAVCSTSFAPRLCPDRGTPRAQKVTACGGPEGPPPDRRLLWCRDADQLPDMWLLPVYRVVRYWR